MNFKPELAHLVMVGGKTVTRRAVSENPRSPWYGHGENKWQPGRTFAICPGRGKNALGRARVVHGCTMELGVLSDREAGMEGFASAELFEETWRKINGGYDPFGMVWRIEFVVCEYGELEL